MTSQNNIFGRNIFNPSSSGIMKKGQLPGHSNANIFGQSNTGINSASGISGIGTSNQNSQATNNPFAAIFTKPFSTPSNNTTAGIFGQKDSNSNQNTGYNFLGKSNTQPASPFGLNNSSQGQSPFFRTGLTGQNGQTNSSGNINFANIFSANRPNTTQNMSNTNNIGGIFSQNQQNNQNSNQNIFGQPQHQTSFTIGGQQQPQNNSNGGLLFQGQNQGQGNFVNHPYLQNQMQGNLNLPSNLQAAVSSYLQSYQNQVGNQPPFGQSREQIANSFYNQIPQFNPSRQDSEYFVFLNNLLRDQTVRKYASPAEVTHFASQWADHNFAHLPSQEEVHRLFDSHALPRPALKALPPVDITPELIESLNEPNQTRAVLSSLVQKIQQRLHLFKQSLLLCEQNNRGSSTKVKDLSCFKQISIMWTELKALKDKVKEMMEKESEIQKKGLIFERNVSDICQKYKQSFAEVNKNITMVEESQKQVSVLSKYLQFHIQPIFKAFLSSSPIPIEDPDNLILSVAASLAAKTESLVRNIDDCLAISSLSVEQQSPDNADPVKLVHSVCLFYQEVAGEVFRVSEKMRKAVNLAARENDRKSEDIQRKVGEKVKLILGRKLQAYYLINQVQQILHSREYGDQTEARPSSRGEGGRERQNTFH